MRPFIKRIAELSDTYVSCYANAGLPNALGEYDQTPLEMAALVRELASDGVLNAVGGCCGTTSAHIKAIAQTVAGLPPRIPPSVAPHTRVSGLELLTIDPTINFVNVGERCNVTGSMRFKRLIVGGLSLIHI